MATTLNLCAVDLKLCFQRGDTFPWTITLKNEAGTAITIPAGNAYKISVDTNSDPSTTAPTEPTTQLFQLTGTVLTQSGATLGQVQFNISLSNWVAFDAAVTAPETVTWDLQEITSGGDIRTLAKGDFEVRQDLTKATT